MIETEKGLNPLLDVEPQTQGEVDEFIHIALQDLYEALRRSGCVENNIPIMESVPPPDTIMEKRKQILRKIVRMKQAI